MHLKHLKPGLDLSGAGPVRVAMDAAVMAHPLTGVARYAFELGKALSLQGHAVEYWTFNRLRGPLTAKVGSDSRIRTFPHLRGAGPCVFPHLWSLISRPDIHHFPNGDLFPSPVPRTAMIHDLAPFLFDDILPPDLRDFYRERTRRIVRLRKVITVNSQTTMDHLLDIFPEASDRCRLTPLGCDHVLRLPAPAGKPPQGLAPGYLLSVGTIEPRKDYATLIRAYRLLSDRPGGSDLPPLVIAGGDGYRADEVRDLARTLLPDDRVRFTGYVDGEMLSSLYAHAAAYLQASLHEGFGLPVAEAALLGLPVAAADNSAISELFSGLYEPFETGVPESAADAMEKVLHRRRRTPDDPTVIRKLDGLTWSNCAALTASAFESVLKRSS